MKKRCLIVLLAVVTVVTMIAAFGITAGATTPVASVTTEGGTENYTSLYDAVQAATQAGRATVTLLEDVTSDGGIVIGEGTVTIDLNGKTWNIAGWFDIRGNADVTIGDSSPSQEGKILGPESSPVVGVYDSGKLEIAGGTLEGMSGQGVISLSFAGNPTSASLVVSGGKLISKGMSVITAHGNSVSILMADIFIITRERSICPNTLTPVESVSILTAMREALWLTTLCCPMAIFCWMRMA